MDRMRPLHAVEQPRSKPAAMHTRAMDNLRFIRQTMESTTAFTAVSGWGGILMGVLGATAAIVTATPFGRPHWLVVWLVTAALASATGTVALLRKARQAGVQVYRGAGRRFLFCLLPPLVAATVLTAVLVQTGQLETIPAMWLLLYGVAIVTGGAVSVRIVPVMGACFMTLSGIAFLLPFSWTPLWMGVGFGGLHLVFGFVIARRYGG